MLRGAMKSLPLDVDRILPDEFDIINKLAGQNAIQQPQAMLPAPGEPAPPEQGLQPGEQPASPVMPEHKPVPDKKPEGTVVGSNERAAGKDHSTFSQGEA